MYINQMTQFTSLKNHVCFNLFDATKKLSNANNYNLFLVASNTFSLHWTNCNRHDFLIVITQIQLCTEILNTLLLLLLIDLFSLLICGNGLICARFDGGSKWWDNNNKLYPQCIFDVKLFPYISCFLSISNA
jgi:hypothetical protein